MNPIIFIIFKLNLKVFEHNVNKGINNNSANITLIKSTYFSHIYSNETLYFKIF